MRKLATLFALICAVVCIPSLGQQRTHVLEESENNVTSCPSIAVNPRNLLNIVAAVRDNLFVSQDGGGTWKKKELASALKPFGDPSLVVDGKGIFYLFHLCDPGATTEEKKPVAIACHVSYDNGETWDQGNVVAKVVNKQLIKPGVSLDSKGTIYVSWTQLDAFNSDNPECQSAVFLSTSGNGKKWGRPIQISQEPGKCTGIENIAGGSMPAATDEKRLFVTWTNQNQVYIDRSFDGGEMWLSSDLPVAVQHGPELTKSASIHRDNTMPVSAVDRSKTEKKGLLYVTFSDKIEEHMSVLFVRSHDFADHWTTPSKVHNTATPSDQFMPWIVIDRADGVVYIAYFERGENNQTNVMLAQSNNAGNSFSVSKISETPFDMPGELNGSLSLSVHKGEVAVIWSVIKEGKTIVTTAVTPVKAP